MTGRVFIVNEPLHRNARGALESKYDLTRARRYGDLILLLEGRVPLSLGPVISTLKDKLRDFGDEDHLLAVGAPAAIAWAAVIAAQVNSGRVKILIWDRDSRSYISVAGALT